MDRDLRSEALRPYGLSIFAEMSALAREVDAIDLSQGFPDFEPPAVIVEAARDAIGTADTPSGENQYAPSPGLPRLREEICRERERRTGQSYSPDDEVTVTCGATEAIAAAILGLCGPGDEVVLFEPFYDSYPASVRMAGATARYVDLPFPSFEIDRDALERAFTPSTRLVVVNTPHNPTGKLFSRSDLEFIAELCARHDAYVIADEVYEQLVFGEREFVPVASVPGLEDRTLSIGSAGKTFSCTGWKIGWALGRPELVRAIQTAHQFLTFSGARPLQHAVATGLAELGPEYYDAYRHDYTVRRDRLVDGLRRTGFEPAVPHGSYFVLADYSNWSDAPDREFAHWLARDVGVGAIPPSPFYADHGEPHRPLVRFGFCKRIETLDAAIERLDRHAPSS